MQVRIMLPVYEVFAKSKVKIESEAKQRGRSRAAARQNEEFEDEGFPWKLKRTRDYQRQ